jgi:hypothetical protein
VSAQKFRIAASIMKRTAVPLTTEYATRLVHLIRGITPEELAGFFDFDAPETRVHGEFLITLRLASGTDRGNGAAKRSDPGRHGRAAVRQIFLPECGR